MTGVVQFRERDGTPKEQAYSGRIASTIKDLGLKAAMAGLRVEALRPGSVGFPRGGRHPSNTATEDLSRTEQPMA
ncbi:hypothetical protein NXT08_15635 [Rhodococcus pyridinivorans]|uniref:hypothetical protein n=1 Tax=Rhodococcus pyridinivorans TaxID=103816 RepID=UPI001E3AC0D8|nr:hypothetical protein [Rhodococcus pyridinivorans]UGQ58645.1 hypothetical protein LSF60_03620 [Rhodococcus pyridinivorans]UVT23748.1 hypothetical protein NXT08_15635 [Rhodococcus pyridinivorans]